MFLQRGVITTQAAGSISEHNLYRMFISQQQAVGSGSSDPAIPFSSQKFFNEA
jgi:hypothetical protein